MSVDLNRGFRVTVMTSDNPISRADTVLQLLRVAAELLCGR
jgi:hypothetical protein